MFYEEELTADDMIAGGRRQLAAVNTRFSFEFFLHNAINCIRRTFALLTKTCRGSRVIGHMILAEGTFAFTSATELKDRAR